ncbi:SDR family NAD(P)-dependent oxidoreductase [Sulfoacidibacillus thermotolerans]|uniref:2-deoxy-D-gluconate 3-dehydrogenase n=1 Tax=Sulfoacidibacillus thermotolerans TaxID=1765684 RepID=A0A2U3DCF5_SULT2|nr:glucose 1-dehydrogenase [Sulfoacidibacillus thermotolerans]PWI58942.1 2-deoxy-D-gluconate 3-dehydrogenase [Sulfoacidibacillus thermotolerans]
MSKNIFDVRGKHVLITGASRGIGFALAQGFAEAGAKVILAARKQEDLEQAARQIEVATGQVAFTQQVDVRDLVSIAACVEGVIEAYGRIDILINNAGLNVRVPALSVTEQDWDTVLDTDLKGAFFMAQNVGRSMVANGGGSIVNISSIGGQVALRTGVAYAAAKAGVLHMTRVLAVEWAAKGVRVNAIGPWYFRTPLTEKLLDNPDYLRDILVRTPMGRVGELHELLGPVLFLASDAASYVTGQALFVDGGMGVYGF